MKSIPYEGYRGPRLPRDMQLERVRRVMQEELTELQREALLAYYFQEKTLAQIAQDRGVNKSTVCRTLHRAEEKLRAEEEEHLRILAERRNQIVEPVVAQETDNEQLCELE